MIRDEQGFSGVWVTPRTRRIFIDSTGLTKYDSVL